MRRIRFEVLPAGDGRWNITRDSVVVDWCNKKDDAVAQAVTRCHVSRAAGVNCQLLIKGKDGQIQDERTYGNDPAEIPG
jgi:hypothetical protein